ncbi:A disintegrin and metalloproteinase with thrombospondin motifs 17 [Dissostichus eleginoides]|uniref:A disintegrin and metalloproteinase with thrombospondin motifs 17 n=1 Tax=Dissostichus eleginoides TaxID=100907 RepID=A0AAD9BXU2_DISEL|nr:A disintegrin and metalloproteinase with thrombospondin motifs 17 [Dissostichus eleginoides]
MHNSLVPHVLLSLLCIGLSAQTELETDEVVPRLLSGQEAHLSSRHTVRSLRRRGQRSLHGPGGGPSDPDHIILSLPAFGRSLYLNLTRDSAFLSRDFVVEERLSGEQSPAVSSLSREQLCFYSGSIINHTDSLASLSTCGGLVGVQAQPWTLQKQA